MTCDKCHKEIEGVPFTGGFIKSGAYRIGQPFELENKFTLCNDCAEPYKKSTRITGAVVKHGDEYVSDDK